MKTTSVGMDESSLGGLTFRTFANRVVDQPRRAMDSAQPRREGWCLHSAQGGAMPNTPQDNVKLVRRGFEAFNKGDVKTLTDIIAADCVQHVPGKNRFSGDHKGATTCSRCTASWAS